MTTTPSLPPIVLHRCETLPEVIATLAALYHRNGYVRRHHRRGVELRMTANDQRELALIRELLAQAGLPLGRPFAKANQFRQPIYGQSAVDHLLGMITLHDMQATPARDAG